MVNGARRLIFPCVPLILLVVVALLVGNQGLAQAPAPVATAPALSEVLGTTNAPDEASAEAAAPAPEFALHPLESQLLALLNRERLERGLQTLELEPRLISLARERSADMATRQYFGHVTPEGKMVFADMDARAIRYRLAGENLARNNYPPDQSPEVAHTGFMNSPTHAENELEPTFSKVGIGVAESPTGQIYFTELFAEMD